MTRIQFSLRIAYAIGRMDKSFVIGTASGVSGGVSDGCAIWRCRDLSVVSKIGGYGVVDRQEYTNEPAIECFSAIDNFCWGNRD